MCNDPVEFPPAPEVSSDAKSLILALLNKDHAQRLSLVGIREHAFLAGETVAVCHGCNVDVVLGPNDIENALTEGRHINPAQRFMLLRGRPILKAPYVQGESTLGGETRTGTEHLKGRPRMP